jgi:hypothetical protein
MPSASAEAARIALEKLVVIICTLVNPAPIAVPSTLSSTEPAVVVENTTLNSTKCHAPVPSFATVMVPQEPERQPNEWL